MLWAAKRRRVYAGERQEKSEIRVFGQEKVLPKKDRGWKKSENKIRKMNQDSKGRLLKF